MKTKLLVILVIFTLSSHQNYVHAQKNTSTSGEDKFIDRIFTGGNIGLQFGTQTMIEVSPIVGYRITDKIAAGLGITYRYYRFKDNYYTPPVVFQTSIYGGSVFARYYIINNVFLHGEYEALSLNTADFSQSYVNHPGTRFLVESLFAGGGYRQQVGEHSWINLMLLYNFNYGQLSNPYSSPLVYRFGLDIGL